MTVANPAAGDAHHRAASEGLVRKSEDRSYHNRWPADRGSRRPEHPRGCARCGDLHPAHLRPSRPTSRRRLPPMRGRGGGDGGPGHVLYHPGRGWHGGLDRHRSGQAGAEAGCGVATCQPPRRVHFLPRIPEMRAAVAHAVPGVHRRQDPPTGQPHFAHRLQPTRRARHGPLHPLWAMRAGLRGTARGERHHLRA